MKILKISREPISLETPVGEEEESHLGDFIEDENGTSPSESMETTSLLEATGKAGDTQRERNVCFVFGSGLDNAKTNEKLGKTLMTRERIRRLRPKR